MPTFNFRFFIITLTLWCGVGLTHADAKPIRHVHCLKRHHRRYHCMPSFSDTRRAPGISNSISQDPNNLLGIPIPVFSVTFDSPYVGSVMRINSFSVSYSASVAAFYSSANSQAQGSPPIPTPNLTFIDTLRVGPTEIYKAAQIIPFQVDVSPTSAPFQVGLYTITPHIASEQFQRTIDVLPGQQVTMTSSVLINAVDAGWTAGQFINSYSFGVISGPATFANSDIRAQLAYDVDTIDSNRSTHGPVY